MRKGIIAVAAVVVLLLGWLGFSSTRPPDFHDYRKLAVESADSAYGAVRTASLAVTASLEHKAPGPYLSVMLDGCVRDASGAIGQFAQLPPPDAGTAAMRDELAPLLAEAVRQTGDVRAAADRADPTGLRDAAAGLQALAERLDDFLERHG